MKSDFFETVQSEISAATGQSCIIKSGNSGFGGGGGASVGSLIDEVSGVRYFYKSGSLFSYEMLNAEFEGVKEMFETNTIKVPRPICKGTSSGNSFVVFEYLAIGGPGSMAEMGKQLAAMHRCTSPNQKFGFRINNTCGATFQPNNWEDSWAEFFDKHRLNYMLERSESEGAFFAKKEQLREKVFQILSKHSPAPSLVHGDLWSGNKGFSDGKPVIFDPATYYGDREVDIAMSHLFGSFGSSFYEAYDNEWKIPEGFEKRKTIYNLYHILNHYVLFGGSYLGQAESMITQILRF